MCAYNLSDMRLITCQYGNYRYRNKYVVVSRFMSLRSCYTRTVMRKESNQSTDHAGDESQWQAPSRTSLRAWAYANCYHILEQFC